MDRNFWKQRLKTDFYTQFSKWAFADAHREVYSEYAFLSTMHHIHVSHYLDVLRLLPKPDQAKLLIALSKEAYQNANEISNTSSTTEEWNLLNVYRQNLHNLPLTRSDIYQAYYIRRNFFSFSLKELRQLACKELGSVLGKATLIERDYLQYQVVAGTQWHISTAVTLDCTGIAYNHILSFLPQDTSLSSEELHQQRLVFSNPISVSRWLGFRDGSWIFFDEQDPIIAVETIALACSHFINSLPTLLNELSTPTLL